jgi:hypothetical protein
MLFREELAVYCENHMEHNNTPCGQNVEFYYVKSCGTYSIHWALKGSYCCDPELYQSISVMSGILSRAKSNSNFMILSRALVTIDGVCIDDYRFIDHLQVVTTINYNAIADFHTTGHCSPSLLSQISSVVTW